MPPASQARLDFIGKNKTQRAFAQVRQGLGGLAKSIGAAKLGTAGLAAGTALLGRRFIAASREAVRYADTIAKVASSFGLSGQALQEYRHAAELAGVSQEKLDRGLQGFAKRVGELQATGKGTLAEYLRGSNDGLLELLRNAPNAESALKILLNAAANTGSQMQRAGLLSAAFGRSAGVEMANLVRGGTSALADNRKEAHELGLVLEDQLLKNAEDLNDEFSRSDKIIKVATTRTLVLAAETWGLADAYRTAAKGAKSLSNFIDRELFPDALAEVDPDFRADQFVKTVRELDPLEKQLNKEREKGFDFIDRMLGLHRVHRWGLEKELELRGKINELTGFDIQDADQLDDAGLMPTDDSYQAYLKQRQEDARDFRRIEAEESAAWAARRVREEIEAEKKAREDAEKERLRFLEAAGERYVEAEKQRIDDLIQVRGLSIEQQIRSSEILTDIEAKQNEMQRKLADAQQERWKSLDETMTKHATDALSRLAAGYGSLREVAVAAIGDITRELIKMSMQAAGGGQGGGIASLLGSLFGGGGSGVRADGFSTSGQFAGFAAGGRPPMGRVSLVGERGPELFMPDRPGTIVPNHEIGGGGTVIQNISVAPDTRAVVRDEILRQAPVLRRATEAGIIDARRRGVRGIA